MRIRLFIAPSEEKVPLDYQNRLVGVVQKWMGRNEIHGSRTVLYSFSSLYGGRNISNALQFKKGASMLISFYDLSILDRVIHNIVASPEMFCGLKVTDIKFIDYPKVENMEIFRCISPVFVKKRLQDGSYKQYTYLDKESSRLLTNTLAGKMRAAGLKEDPTMSVSFLTEGKAYRKIVARKYRKIRNKVNICPVVIKGTPETKKFALDVGVGNSTGIGYGCIY